ncbi:MAG: hypothetical protein QOJ33_163, partial [Chloroflexota bacterium]|nr:hypothetical protein [Chloroflexota bacterium]
MSINSPTSDPDISTASASLTLTPTEPVAAITDGEAAAMVRLDPATASKIDALVIGYVTSIASVDPQSPDFVTKLN